jgi:hypothetical protein
MTLPFLLFIQLASSSQTVPSRVEVVVSPALESFAVDGRLLLLFSSRGDSEPRFHVVNRSAPQPFFGIDVEGLVPRESAVFDDSVLGYPVESLRDLPPGEYSVQAVLNRYTTFRRADGHVVKLHMDQWEGQQWNKSPGNLFSVPRKVRVDPGGGITVRLELTERIPEISPPEDTEWIRHVRIRSASVSRFWGRDMDVGAAVLVPPGFETRPEDRYPVAYLQDHFAPTFTRFREAPPDSSATGRERETQESAHLFYQDWTSGKLPRMLVVLIQDPNPFYDDAYAVNSVNVGPYGDAMVEELIPHVEKTFRAIGEGWARTLFGGSTGGWRALAAQVFHPEFFNGAWVFCPDPVDFRYFQLVNIYEDENAYYPGSGFKKSPVRPWMRSVDDQVLMDQRDASLLELVLGTRGRSGDQMDIFQAVYGPVGPDGYPRLLYDKETGVIDQEVAAYWKENYDLRHILERDWATLGPKLQGKIRVYMGDTDTYYLEEATLLLEKFLESADNPGYGGKFVWGRREPHCYTGAPKGANFIAHYLPEMAEHVKRTAPAGARFPDSSN